VETGGAERDALRRGDGRHGARRDESSEGGREGTREVGNE
jgi:hypothetical protein